MYNYEVLFINIADLFWVFWYKPHKWKKREKSNIACRHFTNHIDAAVNGHVTDNQKFCTTMGMFTHLGIGWELSILTIVTLGSNTF